MPKKNRQLSDLSHILYEKLSGMNNGVRGMEFYEFRYALENIKMQFNDLTTDGVPSKSAIEEKISDHTFYEQIEFKPVENKKIVLDKSISELNRDLFTGIIEDIYDLDWINMYFYFDIRGFIFIPRTIYFTEEVLKHLRNKPFKCFEQRQKKFESYQGVGYKDFKDANSEIDLNLIHMIEILSRKYTAPVVIAIAGPTAAGKTEFSEYLRDFFTGNKKSISSLEIDNFLKDRDYRESIGSSRISRDSIHFELFKNSLINLKNGEGCDIPKYDFGDGISSHDNDSRLRSEASTNPIQPEDIIFLEGNYPFLFEEIVPLIDIKIFYLTDDPIRLKRKWKRDIDYRKKYNSNYLCNRYFHTQFLKAQSTYISQLKTCDIAVDTTDAKIFVSDSIEKLLSEEKF